jgi:crotonobetainyl-CoA:carnitine CoA-transferase CaiB-like acyl-CoA transferase
VYGADAGPVKARLTAVFATRTRKDWIEALAGADCCVSPVLTIDQALADEQLRARKMIVDGGGITQLGLPLKFSEFEFGIERSAPATGEHTGEILREAGFGEAEIVAMRNEGVI